MKVVAARSISDTVPLILRLFCLSFRLSYISHFCVLIPFLLAIPRPLPPLQERLAQVNYEIVFSDKYNEVKQTAMINRVLFWALPEDKWMVA